MRKLIGVLVFSTCWLFAVSSVHADEKGAGCGLGKMIFSDSKGMMPNLSAATTNSSSYSQSFGITSGTSGCDVSQTVKIEIDQTRFLANNMEQLINDISRGQGEYLIAYGKLLGCSAESLTTFSDSIQTHYESLVSGGLEAPNVLNNTKKLIHENPYLQNACSAVI